jgi:hypothetical protein
MPQTRRFAFVTFLVLLAAIFAGQPAATPDVVEAPASIEPAAFDMSTFDDPSMTLVENDWCAEACSEECGDGECAIFNSTGCTCNWLCESGRDGSTYCTGAIGISICAN